MIGTERTRPTMGEDSRQDNETIRSEVEKTFHLLTEAWIRGDMDTLEKYYHDKILGFEPDCPDPIAGKSTVLAHYRKFLDTGGRIAYLKSRDIRVQPFGDTALLTYRFRTGRTLPGGRSIEFTGKETLLFVLQDGIWKLSHWHYSIDK